MKKIILISLIILSNKGFSQYKTGVFRKNPVINLENFQKQRLHFGYYLGLNFYDYKFTYKSNQENILVNTSTGFNVGIIGNLRLQEYLDLRFEPGLTYTKRDLIYPKSYFTNPRSVDLLRETNGTYINLPLLLKFSSLRTGNIRPYLNGGMSANLNLSSNEKSQNDNFDDQFRMKSWSFNYEIGFGIDIFSEYFIFSPSIRGIFGLTNEAIADKNPNSPWTSNIESMKSRGVFINFTFH